MEQITKAFFKNLSVDKICLKHFTGRNKIKFLTIEENLPKELTNIREEIAREYLLNGEKDFKKICCKLRRSVTKRINNPVKHIRWSFSLKYLTTESR